MFNYLLDFATSSYDGVTSQPRSKLLLHHENRASELTQQPRSIVTMKTQLWLSHLLTNQVYLLFEVEIPIKFEDSTKAEFDEVFMSFCNT